MRFNKIFILGAGAIGSVYGALLSRRNDVTLIGNKAHTNIVNSTGLSISGSLNAVFNLKAKSEIREIPESTLIILTAKAYDSATAIERIKKLIRKDTVILILQNGLGNEEVVRSIVGDEIKILRGITMMAAEFFEPGKIKFWRGETIIEKDKIAETIAEIFNECALKTSLSNDIKKEVWNKLIVNCVINPLTALFHIRNCEIAADSLKTVRNGILRECIEVGKAEGMTFAPGLEEKINKEIADYTNFSSMYQDIMKGKKTEIDFLNGRIVKLGRQHRIPTPINETIACLIKFKEEKHELSRKN